MINFERKTLVVHNKCFFMFSYTELTMAIREMFNYDSANNLSENQVSSILLLNTFHKRFSDLA